MMVIGIGGLIGSNDGFAFGMHSARIILVVTYYSYGENFSGKRAGPLVSNAAFLCSCFGAGGVGYVPGSEIGNWSTGREWLLL